MLMRWVVAVVGMLLVVPMNASAGPRSEESEAKSRSARRPAATRRDAIDWSGAEKRRRVNASALTADARAQIAQSTVPVLLPRKEELLRSAVVIVGDGWYTATMKGADHHVFVRGTRIATPVARSERERAAVQQVKDSMQVARIDGIVSVSFSANGAAYNFEIECKRGQRDRMCSDDGPVRQLFKGMALAGGRKDAAPRR